MVNKTIFTFLILILSAVGANAQTGYKTAKEKIKIGGKSIVVKSEVYLNLMPQIISDDPKEKPDCLKSGSLIAPVTIESADKLKLPKEIEIKQLWIKSGDVWQQVQISKNETNKKENSIYSIARTCPNGKINRESLITLVVELKYKGKSYFVRSNQTKLMAVY